MLVPGQRFRLESAREDIHNLVLVHPAAHRHDQAEENQAEHQAGEGGDDNDA